MVTLQDPAESILFSIAKEFRSVQSEAQRSTKSKGLALPLRGIDCHS